MSVSVIVQIAQTTGKQSKTTTLLRIESSQVSFLPVGYSELNLRTNLFFPNDSREKNFDVTPYGINWTKLERIANLNWNKDANQNKIVVMMSRPGH